MRSLVPPGAKTIGKLIIVLVVSLVGGYFALASGYYGATGVFYAFKEHDLLSEAAMVYWILLLQAILSANGVTAAWAWLLLVRSVKPLAKRGS